MNKTNTTAEYWRLQLIAAACAVQHATGTESNVIPLPGTKKYLLIGDEAALTKLLAAEQSLKFPDPAPLPLRTLGGLMANVLYELAQRPGDALASRADDLRKQWDEGRAGGSAGGAAAAGGCWEHIEAPTADTFAVNFIEQRAVQYLQDHADTEPGTGAVVFEFGKAGREYHSALVDLAEDIRAALCQADTQVTAACAARRVKAPVITEHDHSEGGHVD